MTRVAAIDYGTVRIGVAISDERKIIAQPLKLIEAKRKHEETAKLIQQALSSYTIETIVLGLPLHLDGKESPMSQEVRQFAKVLESTLNIPVVLYDERLTSVMTERALIQGNVRREKRKQLIDSLSAAVLLQTYLDMKHGV